MDVTQILTVFRIIASEFSEVGDDTVKQWIELTAPLVSHKIFGILYTQALSFLTAHRMKVATVGVDVSEALSDAGVISAVRTTGVANYSEGEVSIGFDTNFASLTAADADLALTQYGVQFLRLRRMRIMPIVSAGEANGRL